MNQFNMSAELDPDHKEEDRIMHDNVAYQSSAAFDADDGARQRNSTVSNYDENKDEDDSDDEDAVMVDNLVYQSYNAASIDLNRNKHNPQCAQGATDK
nr:hypothetical protein BaRGS_004167 [Batillaria attramentaria]